MIDAGFYRRLKDAPWSRRRCSITAQMLKLMRAIITMQMSMMGSIEYMYTWVGPCLADGPIPSPEPPENRPSDWLSVYGTVRKDNARVMHIGQFRQSPIDIRIRCAGTSTQGRKRDPTGQRRWSMKAPSVAGHGEEDPLSSGNIKWRSIAALSRLHMCVSDHDEPTALRAGQACGAPSARHSCRHDVRGTARGAQALSSRLCGVRLSLLVGGNGVPESHVCGPFGGKHDAEAVLTGAGLAHHGTVDHRANQGLCRDRRFCHGGMAGQWRSVERLSCSQGQTHRESKNVAVMDGASVVVTNLGGWEVALYINGCNGHGVILGSWPHPEGLHGMDEIDGKPPIMMSWVAREVEACDREGGGTEEPSTFGVPSRTLSGGAFAPIDFSGSAASCLPPPMST